MVASELTSVKEVVQALVLLLYGVTAGLLCSFSHFLNDRTVWFSARWAGGAEPLGIFNVNLLGVRAIKRACKLELHLGHLGVDWGPGASLSLAGAQCSPQWTLGEDLGGCNTKELLPRLPCGLGTRTEQGGRKA